MEKDERKNKRAGSVKKIDKRIGNQFWKLADPETLGRPRIFKTPAELWEKAQGYFQECDENPLKAVKRKSRKYKTKEYSGFSDEEIETLKIPYTWEGLYVYLGVCDLEYYRKDRDFSKVLTHIRNIMYNQKFSGAAAGIFNHSIIARDLGLKEHTEHTGEITINQRELDRRAQELEDEAGV